MEEIIFEKHLPADTTNPDAKDVAAHLKRAYETFPWTALENDKAKSIFALAVQEGFAQPYILVKNTEGTLKGIVTYRTGIDELFISKMSILESAGSGLSAKYSLGSLTLLEVAKVALEKDLNIRFESLLETVNYYKRLGFKEQGFSDIRFGLSKEEVKDFVQSYEI